MMLHRSRVRRLAMTLMGCGVVWLIMQWIDRRLGDVSTWTGIVLLLATLSLYLLTIRKRVVTHKLGNVSFWLRLHSDLGTFASIIFLLHINWPIQGAFELCLASCFCFVAISGIALGVVSRITPVKLTALRHDFQLEQIPELQLAVARDAHNIAISSTRIGEGATLSEYYQRRLLPYFQSPRNAWYRLMPTGNYRRRLQRELEDLDRYLAGEGLQHRRRLSAMVQSKDDLDYHYALQTRLRWLYAGHVALTWTLLILVAVHVVLVVRFSGAML